MPTQAYACLRKPTTAYASLRTPTPADTRLRVVLLPLFAPVPADVTTRAVFYYFLEWER